MRRIKLMMKTAVALGLLVLGCSLAQAGPDRTWVSGVNGDDINPCSRTAPCKTFAKAYQVTAAGGQINVVDAGSFGTLTIDHSITIDGSESFSGILASNDVNGVIVNAGASDVVVLRGLSIQGAGENGIKFVAGGKLYVEDCRIFGGMQRGIDFEPTGKSELYVKDSILRDHSAAGIGVQPGAAGSAQVTIEHTRLEGNQNGISVLDNSKVTMRDSVASSNSSNGVLVTSTAASTEVNLEDCLIANNSANGIKASGSGNNKAKVRFSGSTVTANGTGLLSGANGTIDSYGDNNVDGNTTNGAPDNTIPQQ
jgi:hypothetical protein